MGWEVTPSDGVIISAPENKNTEIYFPANTTKTDITYTVRFIDGNGDCGSKKITVKSCDGLPCDLQQVDYSQTTVIPAQPGDYYFFLFTYKREGNCQFNIEEVTSYNVIRDLKITEIDDGYNAIAAQINDNTGSKRTFRIKVTLDGSDIGTFDFEQQGTTPEPEPTDLGKVYMNFELRNNTGQSIYAIPKIKLWVAKPPYIGLFYIQKKDWVDRDCSDFEIPPYDPNHPLTLSYMDLAFVGDSRIQDTESDPDHWITLHVPASFINDGMLLQSSNNEEPYLYTYINGSNVPSNQRIKVFLVNPETGEKLPLGSFLNFSAGTESNQANYILDISLKEGASGTINSCTQN